MDTLLFLGIGVVIGAAVAWAIAAARRSDLSGRLVEAGARAEGLVTQLSEARLERDQARVQLAESDARREEVEIRAARLGEQVEAGARRLLEQQRLLDEARAQLTDTFKAVGAEALQANSRQFLQLAGTAFERLLTEARGDGEKRQQAIDGMVKPLKELLDRQNQTLNDMERKRAAERSGLEQQLKAIASAHDRLGAETSRLVTALRRPEQRGRWGEMQLRNAVEMAGMTKHCDFIEQPTTRDAEGARRPDMIVRLPGDGVIVVDAKVALDAYLDALDPDAPQEDLLKRHARQVTDHVRGLASRRYWEQFDRTPKIVVMFMPLEPALVAALQVNPDLHQEAMQQQVLIATPTLLVALLRAVAYGWQQEDVAANAREIARVGQELHRRLAKFVTSFEKVGTSIQRAASAYNGAVGSLEARVLPSARALKDLHATTESHIEPPSRLPADVRRVTATELKPADPGDEPLAEDAESAERRILRRIGNSPR